MKKLYATLVLLFCLFITYSQTLVNLAWKDTIGHPTVTVKGYAGTSNITNDIMYIAGNSYTTGQQENFFIVKMNAEDGSIYWKKDYDGNTGGRDFGLGLAQQGDYVYITGISWDSTNSRSSINTFKISTATGDTVWSRAYKNSYNGYNAAARISVDDTGNVYVAGTEQTASLNFGMVVIKYDSLGSVLWTGGYDSTFMYDAAIDMQLDPGKNLAVTGFSGNGFSSWDFVTVGLDPTTGVNQAYNRYGNGAGNFSQPVGIERGNNNSLIIAGTSAHSGQTDIKLIAYDSTMTQLWVHKWGDSTLNEEAVTMENDFSGSNLIGGTQTKANGGKDMVLLRYDHSTGTLIWSKTISAPDPTKEASLKAISNDGNGGAYITGRMHNGNDFDIATAHIDADGNLEWLKTYSRGANTNDDPDDIEYDDNGGVVVTATSMGGDTVYLMLGYETWKKTKEVEPSTIDIPEHAKNEVIVRFKASTLKRPKFFATMDKQYSTIGNLIDSALVAKMDVACNGGGRMDSWKAEKVFFNITSNDSSAITRRGDTIHIPAFWTTLILTLPDGYSEVAVNDSLQNLRTDLVYSQLNYVGHLDASPNDTLYSDNQTSLHYNSSAVYSYPDGHIHQEQAWNMETGKSFVRVGVFDSGIDLKQPDLGYNSSYMDNRVKDGWDVPGNFDQFQQLNVLADSVGHGTACAGIIGAVTNNAIGVSGIAGGWYNQSNIASNNTNGISLYGAKLFYNIYGQNPTAFLSHTANAIVASSLSQGTGAYTWGLHVMNNSWGIDSINTPDIAGNSNEFLLRDAVHFVNRQQVIFVASRGNSGGLTNDHYYTHLPACYDDDWVVNVSSANERGAYSYGSLWGRGVDICAPSYPGNVFTTNAITGPDYNYVSFGSTSAAAAHVSGVTALLLSYANDATDTYRNLAPEDVEFILQKSSSDRSPTGYDDKTGYGFLLADSALLMIEKPKHYVKHFGNSQGVSADFTVTPISIDTVLQFNESSEASNQTNLAPFTNYRCDVYKINTRTYHTLDSTEQIQYAWERHSASNTVNAFDSLFIWPHERVNLLTYTNSYCDMEGYVYFVRSMAGASIGWYPSDTTSAKTKLEYSLLIYNPTLSDISRITEDAATIYLFPNPASNRHTLRIYVPAVSNLTIKMYDVQGRFVKDIFDGKATIGMNDFTVNVSSLEQSLYFYQIQTDKFKRIIKFNKL